MRIFLLSGGENIENYWIESNTKMSLTELCIYECLKHLCNKLAKVLKQNKNMIWNSAAGMEVDVRPRSVVFLFPPLAVQKWQHSFQI